MSLHLARAQVDEQSAVLVSIGLDYRFVRLRMNSTLRADLIVICVYEYMSAGRQLQFIHPIHDVHGRKQFYLIQQLVL